MTNFEKLLSGGDLRSIGKSERVFSKVCDQRSFDELFKFLFHEERIIVMRTADIIEKLTIDNPDYLTKHKKIILQSCHKATNKELKWHLALLISRLQFNTKEFEEAWNILLVWAQNKNESRIVRVNSIQGLFEMLTLKKENKKALELIIDNLEKENIPSINSRIRKLRKSAEKKFQ